MGIGMGSMGLGVVLRSTPAIQYAHFRLLPAQSGNSEANWDSTGNCAHLSTDKDGNSTVRSEILGAFKKLMKYLNIHIGFTQQNKCANIYSNY